MNAEVVTEDMASISDQGVAGVGIVTAMYTQQKNSFHHWMLSSLGGEEGYLPCFKIIVLLPLMR